MSPPRWLTKFPYRGVGICSWCGKATPPKRRYWCSKECVEEWMIRSNATSLRRATFERDRGVCALCGVDTEAVHNELTKLYYDALARQVGAGTYHASHALAKRIPDSDPYRVRMRELGSPKWMKRSLWEADHIQTVVEGGGGCGLENIRTLCWKCHAAETAKLHARLKEFRRHCPPDVEAWLDELGTATRVAADKEAP
jgi:5-methylcytosine-specific restriction endonuclease McrA